MTGAAEILVIILSVFLALFLLLAIILTVLLIKVTKQIKKVTSTAQNATDSINSIAANISRYSSPMLVGKMIMQQFKKRK